MRKLAVLLFIINAFAGRAQILLQDVYQGPGNSSPDFEVLSNQAVLFAATTQEYGRELWITQGSCEQSTLLLDIFPGTAGSDPEQLTRIGSLVYFTANDGINGHELWVTDGTVSGTRMIRDIYAGAFGSAPQSFVQAGDFVYFSAIDAGIGREIWRTNGTEAGTQLVKDVQPGPAWGFGISDEMVAYKDSLFFSVFDFNTGESLWKTAGTPASTVLVKDYGTGGCIQLYVYNNLLLQTVSDATHGFELWRSDGSTAGTYLIKDINPGTGDGLTSDEDFEQFGSFLYFPANDGVNGKELWRTDGTAMGTQLVKDVRPGPVSSNILDLEVHENFLYFDANDGTQGKELWRTDGSDAGTQMVKDIGPGSQDGLSNIPFLKSSGDWLFFSANDGIYGSELWQSDGTEAGTQMVIDVEAGPDPSSPWRLTNFNGTLLWSATTSNIGGEPYINLPAPMGGPELIVKVDTVQGLTCFGVSDGRIEITVVQGVCPYLFYWSNGATTEDIRNINTFQDGIYSVTIVDAAGHEVVLFNLNVVEPDPLSLTEVEYLQADCNGNLGSITLAGTGGTPPYAFLWDDGFTGATRINVPADAAHQITVTDAHGCTRSGVYGFQPEFPVVGDYTDTNVGCNSDTVLLTPLIPTFIANKSTDHTDYTYLWTASNGGVILSAPDTVSIFVLGPGTFTLIVTDTVNGCMTERVVQVGVDTLQPVANAGPDLVVPCSQSDFTLNASYSLNGAGTPEFLWTYYDGINDPQVLWNSNNTTIDVHYSGTYVFTVLNINNGCSDSDTVVVAPSNLSPPISATGGVLNCVTTEVTLQAMLGGEHTLFNGWTGPDGFFSLELNPVINISGGYTAIATDTVNGCTASNWLFVDQNLDMPNVGVVALGDGLSCAQPTMLLEVYTFVSPAPYSYAWSGPNNFSSTEALVEIDQPGLYTVVTTHGISGCTDVQQIEVTAGEDTIAPQITCPPAQVVGSCQTTVVYSLPGVEDNCPVDPLLLEQTGGLSSGSSFPIGTVLNTFEYTDPGGHVVTCSFTIEVRPPASLQATAMPALCNQICDGSAEVQISGDPPYSILWSNGSSSLELNNLCAGTYTVTVFDGNGCAYLTSAIVAEPESITVAVDSIVDDIGSQGIGAIYISASGGTPPLDFLWTNLTTGQTYTGENISGLTSAYYQSEIIDANDCSYMLDSIFVNNLVGTTEVDWTQAIILYPNPATQFVNLVYPSDSEVLPEINVFNITGQRVDVGTTVKYPGHLLLNTVRLVPGVYQVWVQLDGKNAVKQLVIVGE